MKVLYLDQAGNGLADEVEMHDGATIEDFIKKQKGYDVGLTDFTVLINRVEARAGQTLNNGDIISVTPKKYGGAELFRVRMAV